MNRIAVAVFTTLVLLAASCSGDDTDDPTATSASDAFAPAPVSPEGPVGADAAAAIDSILAAVELGFTTTGLPAIAESGDPRLLWILNDFLRFMSQDQPVTEAYIDAAESLIGAPIDRARPWHWLSTQLIAWDIPAPPGYRSYKGDLYSTLDPRWAFVFSDPDADIDYRWIGWGGVLIDDRELGDPERCRRGCIPSLDDPALTPAADGGWYPDDAVVFGVVVGDDAVAFPRNIMEIHEMVNMTIGDRRIGMPYCTLCGSAQAFLTDVVDDVDRPPVLRTSGLLSRSNKVMYDLDSQSVFDTFTGDAISGPLRAAGVVLPQIPVITTTWGDWRASHPETRIIAEDGGVGRTYALDPLGGRDDEGPIFPIGDTDDRLPVQEAVLGVVLDDGTPVAFAADAARRALDNGDTVELAGVTVVLDGNGVVVTQDGERLGSHQAFWFAWSQFHPDTLLWSG